MIVLWLQEAAEEAKALASALTMAGELYLALALPTDAVAALKRAMSLHQGQVRCTASYAVPPPPISRSPAAHNTAPLREWC